MPKDISRFEAEIIPTSYASWRYCIEAKCGISLTHGYLDDRIRILANPAQEETQRFARSYGHEHLGRVLGWFRQARAAPDETDAGALIRPETTTGSGQSPESR